MSDFQMGFYFVTTGWIFEIGSCENSIQFNSRFACLMFSLCVTSQMHSDQLVAGLVQLASRFFVSIPNHGGERSRMSP